MIKVYTENNERKIKICFHNTFLFSPRVYKDKMSSNSFDAYFIFCENLRKEHTSYLVPQFWEWLNTRSTEISVTSGRPQCSYNSANQNQESYISFSQNKESYDPQLLKINISQRKTGSKKRDHWSTKQTSVLVKCLKDRSSKLKSAGANEFWNIIRDEVNEGGP